MFFKVGKGSLWLGFVFSEQQSSFRLILIEHLGVVKTKARHPFLVTALTFPSLHCSTVEQYYTTNIQKNQLVQNDIRVAKKLQDEEEEQWTQQTAISRQASKQL